MVQVIFIFKKFHKLPGIMFPAKSELINQLTKILKRLFVFMFENGQDR